MKKKSQYRPNIFWHFKLETLTENAFSFKPLANAKFGPIVMALPKEEAQFRKE